MNSTTLDSVHGFPEVEAHSKIDQKNRKTLDSPGQDSWLSKKTIDTVVGSMGSSHKAKVSS